MRQLLRHSPFRQVQNHQPMGWKTKNVPELKENLSQVLVDKIIPISLEIKKLLTEKNYLDQILLEGSRKAENIAAEKLKKIQKIIGF